MGIPITVPIMWLVLGAAIGWIVSKLTGSSAGFGAGAGVLGAIVGAFVALQLDPPSMQAGSISFVPTFAYAAVGTLAVALLVALIRKAR
ncbi:MAG: GlsB/YeaQ/YmgE family stress response membrane protein [Hyphomonadaceae bacterium]